MFLAIRDDLGEALRRVRRNARLTLTAVCTLALGIGASTGVFTMVHTVLYALPPFRAPDRIVALTGRLPGYTNAGISEADLDDYRAERGLFDAAAFTDYAEFSWTGQSLPGFDGAEVLRGLVVTDAYFDVFDQPMAMGRGFRKGELREEPRLPVVLTAAFAALAMTLAGVGLFGVIGYWVSRRLKELGVRSALGAKPAELRALVLAQASRLMAVGVAMGALAALGAMRMLRSLLYGMSDRDTAVHTASIGLTVVVTLLACWLPAVRASRVDPATALREE
jgi:hypothetical protein